MSTIIKIIVTAILSGFQLPCNLDTEAVSNDNNAIQSHTVNRSFKPIEISHGNNADYLEQL